MISVVLASFNGEKYIIEQLRSILSQTLPVDEVVIYDDGSSDSTVSLCKDFIKENGLNGWRVIEGENVGYCKNFYRAIFEAQGDIIFLSDQDDVWEKEKVEKMCEVMNRDSEILSLSSRYTLIDADGNPLDEKMLKYMGDTFDGSLTSVSVDSLIGCSYIRGFSMCIKGSLKEKLKEFKLDSLLSHDWYLSLLSASLGKCRILNLKLAKYRLHGENTSLTARVRKTLLGEKNKRIEGLKESIIAHSEFCDNRSDYKNITDKDSINFTKMINCEKYRLAFLVDRGFVKWLSLIRFLPFYKRYYKSLFGGIKIWVGDLLYAYNINFKK